MPGNTHRVEITMAAAIRRYFDVCLYLLIFTGFGTLASTGRLDLASVVLVSSALLFRGYILARRHQVLLSERWTNLLTIACVGYYIADEFVISRTFLTALVHLVLFVMLVRLFSAQKDRDHYFLALLSFGMVLAAALLTVDSTFLLALGGFVLVSTATFILMEMMHASERAPVLARDLQSPAAYRKLSFAIVGIAPVLLTLILLGGSLIFFVLPRVSAGYLSAYSGGGDLSSGFSDHVELGRIGQIQRSRMVVMHVRIDGDTTGVARPKLRGVTLNNFDGRSWNNTHERYLLRRGSDNRFDLRQHTADPGAEQPRGRRLHYQVTLEPFVNITFFLLAIPQSVEGNYRVLSVDSAADVYNFDPEHPVTRYEADSLVRLETPPLDHARLENAARLHPSYPRSSVQEYLQLPRLDPRVLSLAQQITARVSDPYAKASALEGYLRSHFGYTLQLPGSIPQDPIADFLFVRREGHCEYFASAMAVMLRSIAIPSRVVNGFSGGEFNDLTSQYVIRASEAHSWVEAYIPGEGWMEFDPTPAGTASAQTNWSRLMLYMDAMESFWREWVVNYDLGHQIRLTQDASRGSREVVSRAQGWAKSRYETMLAWARKSEERLGQSTVFWGERVLLLFVIGLFAASLPRLIAFLRALRLARRPERAPRAAATVWYERMLHHVARRGWEKRPAQTPTEFASGIENNELRNRVRDFTERYERARFGNSREQAARLPGLYAEIKNAGRAD
jgi:transglutaminase-like putative cysteine protease